MTDLTPPKRHDWREHFSAYTTSTAFSLQISKYQCALLCAIEDGTWSTWWTTGPRNHFYGMFLALDRRGLVERNEEHYSDPRWTGWRYRLTPAGKHVLALLRLAGLVPDTAANETAHSEKVA